jgi:glycerophosphoryl diester phosphodiesterase
MMRKILILLVSILFIFLLSSCASDRPGEQVHTHAFGDWTVVKESTCSVPGIQIRFCVECNYTESDSVDTKAHDFGAPQYTWSHTDRSLTAQRVCLRDSSHVETETVVAAYGEEVTSISKLHFSNDASGSYFDLSNRFRQMIQPSWIDYTNGGKTGTAAEFYNNSASAQPHKCGVGHAVYLCNRTFILSNGEDYEMVIVKMDEDLNIIENTGWVKGTYVIRKNECAWFSIILRSADCTSVVDRLSDVVSDLTVLVSEEDFDQASDLPLVLGIMDFTSDGVMSVGETFTTYNGFKILGLAYPITNERKVEQTNRSTAWNQSLITYDAANGSILQRPAFYNSMTWVDTLENENLFVFWERSDHGDITYDQAMEACSNISVKVLGDGDQGTWVMDVDSEFKVSSHRIEAQLAPRNTYSALEFAYNRGYRWFESDVHLTEDLVPVMLHDRNISHVSNGNANIDSLSYEEALQYDFGSWHSPKFAGEKILRLEDMLRFCAEHDCGVNLEFKSSSVPAWNVETIGIVYDLIQKYGMEDRVMLNGNGAEIAYLKIYLEYFDDTAEVQWLPGSLTEDNIRAAKELQTGKNVVRICVPWGEGVTKELVDYAKSQGILVDVHCVSGTDNINPAAFKEMLSVGVSGIITESANTAFYKEESESISN